MRPSLWSNELVDRVVAETRQATAASPALSTSDCKVKVIHHGMRTIWEDEDDFINICINDTKRLWSSGGRLYCNDFGDYDYSLKLLK
jgi:hypothetical protein